MFSPSPSSDASPPSSVDSASLSPPPAVSLPGGRAGSVSGSNSPYTEETYQIVSDLVFTYRNEQEAGMEQIRTGLGQLKQLDPALGELWEKIMIFWSHVNTDLSLNRSSVPEGLPEDETLCIVVLGFQLQYDGSMAPELLGRCETALRCLERYPNALLAVTGGGTAIGNPDATEADAMWEWFLMQGVSPERILVEARSLTTGGNAANTCRLLAEEAPEVRELLIVSSDYHIRLGTLLFQTAAYLHEYEHGTLPYTVAANAAWATTGNPAYESVSYQAQDLWSLTDPRL